MLNKVLAAGGSLGNKDIYSPGNALGGNSANYGKLISPIIQNALIALGGLSLITILIAGFSYINSEGDERKIEIAQKTLTYAIIGIVVAVAGFLITRLIGYIVGFDFTTGTSI
jgi:hypothetical protein